MFISRYYTSKWRFYVTHALGPSTETIDIILQRRAIIFHLQSSGDGRNVFHSMGIVLIVITQCGREPITMKKKPTREL